MRGLEKQEKKLLTDIKKTAEKGNTGAAPGACTEAHCSPLSACHQPSLPVHIPHGAIPHGYARFSHSSCCVQPLQSSWRSSWCRHELRWGKRHLLFATLVLRRFSHLPLCVAGSCRGRTANWGALV
jgi:hypothetical protein